MNACTKSLKSGYATSYFPPQWSFVDTAEWIVAHLGVFMDVWEFEVAKMVDQTYLASKQLKQFNEKNLASTTVKRTDERS